MISFTAPDEGCGLEAIPKHKIQRDPSPQKGNLMCWPPLYFVFFAVYLGMDYYRSTGMSLARAR